MQGLPAVICALLLSPSAGSAEERFPRPEFSTGYQAPPISTPAPRPDVLAYVDIGVLIATLALATYVVYVRRSRRDLVLLVLFALAYFGFYRQGCVCAVGSVQNMASALAGAEAGVPLVVGAFFALPLLLAIFCGRVFCGSVCPLGAAQELVLLWPRKTPRLLDFTLGMVPAVYLGFAVLFAVTGSAFIICRYDPFILFFRLGGSMGMLLAGVAVLGLATTIGRPYCRYLCPYSVLLRAASVFSRWRVRTTPGECVNCHLCADACPYGAILPPTTGERAPRRAAERRQLALCIVLLPVLVGVGAVLARMGSPVLARVHPTVALADRVWLEEEGRVEGQTPASEAFAAQALRSSDLYAEAALIRGQFDRLSWFLGGWLGLVSAMRLIGAGLRRRRTEYQVDVAACVACGRCYAACPVAHAPRTVLRGTTMERAE